MKTPPVTILRRCCFAVVATLLGATLAAAGDYAKLGQAAKESFQPVEPDYVAAARGDLARAVIEAERLLSPTTNQGAGWGEFLAWDGVQKQLAPDAKTDLDAARETLRRLGTGAPGLEKPELQRVAAELESYIGLARFAQAPADKQRIAFERVVDGLVKGAADPSALSSARASHQLEQSLRGVVGLADAGASQSLAAAVRQEFGRPNLWIEVQTPVLNQLVTRPVVNCDPISDVILGTRIVGTGATTARVTLSTVPSYERARLAFQLAGSVSSRTTGVNGPVRISSLGQTSFQATKLVELTDDSFYVLPASASATTRSRTQGVQKIGGGFGRRIVERIARRRVAEQKGQADAIAGSRAEGRIAQRLDQQLGEQIVEARERYDELLSRPLRRRLATPRMLHEWTTGASLVIQAVQADDAQLAAADTPPGGVAAPIAAKLHQTAVNNLLDACLAGATVRRDAAEKPARVNVVTPAWFRPAAQPVPEGEEFQPWSVRLRDPRPVSVEFTPGRLTATVHAAEIKADGETFKDWDLIASYRPEIVEGRWRLGVLGEIDAFPTGADPADPKSIGAKTGALRSSLTKLLNQRASLPESIAIDPVDLSSRGGPIRALSLTGLEFSQGWVAAGWRPD